MRPYEHMSSSYAQILNRSVHDGPEPGGALAEQHARIRERPAAAAAGTALDLRRFCASCRRRGQRGHRLERMIGPGGVEVVWGPARRRHPVSETWNGWAPGTQTRV